MVLPHQIQNINKGRETVKKNQREILELKRIRNEMKNSLEGLKTTYEAAEEKPANLKIDGQKLCNLKKEQREKRMTKNEQSLRETWDIIKTPTTHNGSPRRKAERERSRKT